MSTNAYKDIVGKITRRYANPDRDKSDTLKKIILTCQLEFDLSNSNVSAGTIKSLLSRGVLTARHPGTPSPMERVEPLLVQLVKACTQNGQNIGQTEVMKPADEWIIDKKIGEELVDWKLNSPSSSLSKKQGFPILSVRRWSDNTAYLVLTVHEVYLKAGRKISQIHQIKKK